MVQNVGGFIQRYLQQLKQPEVKYNQLQNDAEKFFFNQFDTVQRNQQLEQDEVENFNKSKEFSQEETTQFLDKINMDENSRKTVLSVIALGHDSNKVVVTRDFTSEPEMFNAFDIYDNSDPEKPKHIERHKFVDDAEVVIKYNDDGTRTVKRGAVTDTVDEQDRVTKRVTDKGSGGVETVDYEYEGNSTTPTKKTVTKSDGSQEVQVEGIETPVPLDKPQPKKEEKQQAEGKVSDSESPSDNGNEQKVQDGDPESKKPEAQIKNGDLYAKNGETFDQTAKRLGFEKGTDEYRAFVNANKAAANRKWFRLSQKIVVPESIKDKVKQEAYEVTRESEEAAYVNATKEKADVSKFEGKTETKTLDSTTSWWMLAKQNLIDCGVANPSNAQIYERIGVLAALNDGKEPTQGTELVLPKENPATDKADDKATDKADGKADGKDNAGGDKTQKPDTQTRQNDAATVADSEPPAATTQGQQTKGQQSQSRPIPQEQRAQLKKLGIPDEVIDKGDKAIQDYAQKHNIRLPERPKPQK